MPTSTRKSGVDGSFKIAATSGSVAIVKGVKSWNCDISIASPDVTGFDSGGWAQTVPGLKRWSGSLTASWDADATAGTNKIIDLFGALADVELIISSTEKISGTVAINSFAVQDGVDGAPEITIQFSGDGAPTLP